MTQFLDHNGEVFHETGKGRWVSSKKDTMTNHWADITVRAADHPGLGKSLFPTEKSWKDSPTIKHWENQAEAVLTGTLLNGGDDEQQKEWDEEDEKSTTSPKGTGGESQKTTIDAFDPIPNSTRQLKESKWKEMHKKGGWYSSSGPVRIRLNPYSMSLVHNFIPLKWRKRNEGNKRRGQNPDPGWKELPTVTIQFEEGKVALFSSSENTGVLQLVADDGVQTVSDLSVKWAKDGTPLGIKCRLNNNLLTVQSQYDGDDDEARNLDNVDLGVISGGAVKIFAPITKEGAEIELDESLAFAYPSPGLKGAQFPTNLDGGLAGFVDFFDKGDKWFGWMKPDEVNMMATLQEYENTDYEGEYLKQLDFSEKDAHTIKADEALFVTVKVLDSTNGFTGNSLVTANQGQIALMFPGDESNLSMRNGPSKDKWGGKLTIEWDANSKTARLVFKDGSKTIGSFNIPSSTEGEIDFNDKTTFGENAKFKGTVLSIDVLKVEDGNINKKYASITEQRRKDNLNHTFTHFQTAKCPACGIEAAVPCDRIDCPMPVETTTISFAYQDDNDNIVIIVPKDTSVDGLTNLLKITIKEKGDDE